MKIGFIGLGAMGRGMAACLLRAGHEVTVYNRTREKTDALVSQGARRAETAADACGGDLVFTMLANDEAVERVVLGADGVLAGLARGAIHVSCSTISIRLSQRLDLAHAGAGQGFVAATVFGRPDVAAAGHLLMVVAGRQGHVHKALPVIEAIGRKTVVIGETPPAANLVKLSGNFLLAALIESLGEAIALVRQGGIDPPRYLDIVTALFELRPYVTYGGLIASGHFQPAGFAAPLGQKDIRLALAAAGDLQVAMPVAELLRERFATLMAYGGEHLDWSAIGALPAIEAGAAAIHSATTTH